MKHYVILYKGPATSPDASHDGWPEWFAGLGDALVDKGGPLLEGWSVGAEKTTEVQQPRLNGYSIIQATDAEAARAVVVNHPYLALGSEYTIELYETPAA